MGFRCAVACMDRNDINIMNGPSPFRVVFDHEDEINWETRPLYLGIDGIHELLRRAVRQSMP